ncbi:hypothetical protein [Aquisphaera insulae]|uniref:hypothetical protein n=1 Tax=Aquisphaera insulae TaxID=2712864 RepID=UPI0013EB7BEC|nr:hypothetical protein [Aquisphaera insulae]
MVAACIGQAYWLTPGQAEDKVPGGGEPLAQALTYTYAYLPHDQMTASDRGKLGASIKPWRLEHAGKDERLRELVAGAGAVLTSATRGKVKIGSLTYVPDILNANLIVALEGGGPDSGWATPAGVGRPGHVGLYYESLTRLKETDATLLVAHLLAHYLFDLPDEIGDPGRPASCPGQDLDAPGCLMANFLSTGPRLGYYGKFCESDHNRAAPSGATLSHDHEARDSCQFLINRFLERRKVSASLATQDTRWSRFDAIQIAARSHLRSGIEAQGIGKNRRTLSLTPSQEAEARRIVRQFLENQVARLRRDPEYPEAVRDDEIEAAVGDVLRFVLLEPVDWPEKFGGKLRTELEGVARNAAAGRPDAILAPFAGQLNPTMEEPLLAPLVTQVKGALLTSLFSNPLGPFAISDTPGPRSILPSDDRFLELLAREAVQHAASDRIAQRKPLLLEGSKAPTAPPAPEQGVRDLVLFLAPDPLDPQYDLIASDGLPYEKAPRLALDILKGGPDGSCFKVENLSEVESPPTGEAVILANVLGKLVKGGKAPAGSIPARLARFKQQVRDLKVRLESKEKSPRVRGIVVLAPNGGIPMPAKSDLKDLCEALRDWTRAAGIGPGEARAIHVIQVGAGHLDLPLGNLGHASGGSVQHIDSVKGLAFAIQQVRSRLSCGTLVSIPQDGVIDLRAVKELEKRGKGPTQGKGSVPEDSRSTVKILEPPNDPSSIQVELDAFTAEHGGTYEFILALDRPLAKLPAEAPVLELYRDDFPTDQPGLSLDHDASSERLLVYRLAPPEQDFASQDVDDSAFRIAEGRYRPRIRFRRDSLPEVVEATPEKPDVNLLGFTFSIATSRNAFHLVAGIREPEGTMATSVVGLGANQVILEAAMIAGAPIVGAEIRGMVTRQDSAGGGSRIFTAELLDDGIFPDLRRGDGIATGRIGLPPSAGRSTADYRIVVEGRTTTESRFIPLVDPVMHPDTTESEAPSITPPMPIFQRAQCFGLEVRGKG